VTDHPGFLSLPVTDDRVDASARSEIRSLCTVAWIRNLALIASAYGVEVVSTVRRKVLERARDFCAREAGFVTLSGENLLFVFERPQQQREADPHAARDDRGIVDAVVAALGDDPIITSSGEVCAAIAATIPEDENAPFDLEGVASDETCVGARPWRMRYMADMQTAGHLLGALRRGDLRLRYEKICNANATGRVEYYEVLLSEVVNGTSVSAGRRVLALERLGLIGRLDRWVVWSVIDMLRCRPGISLGCNVSVQSARLEGWWLTVIETLAGEPQVAARLVIEITESVPMTDLDAMGNFVRAMQLLGCRVALDDVGAGYSSLRILTELRMDIAKVDREYLHQARSSADARKRVGALIGLARACVSHVVLEGVERDEDLQLSRDCGAHWAQGYLFEPVLQM